MLDFAKAAFPWILYGLGLAIYIKYMNSKSNTKDKI